MKMPRIVWGMGSVVLFVGLLPAVTPAQTPAPAEIRPGLSKAGTKDGMDDGTDTDVFELPADLTDSQRLNWVRQWRMVSTPPSGVRTILADIARQDECEPVRYEAVTILWEMLAADVACASDRVPVRVVCRTRHRGILGRLFSRVFGTSPRTQYVVATTAVPCAPADADGASPCCEPAVLRNLSAIAHGDESQSSDEPSPRVRSTAAAALALCEQLGPCAEQSVPPAPSSPVPQKHHPPRPGFHIEEPPAGPSGFEPLAPTRPLPLHLAARLPEPSPR